MALKSGTLLDKMVEAILMSPGAQGLYMNEHTFEQIARESGRTDHFWRNPGAINRVMDVRVYVIDIPDGEWFLG